MLQINMPTSSGARGRSSRCLYLIMPAHHDVRSSDVFVRRLHGTLAAATERGPVDFPDLLLTPGVGARTVQSLAMVAEVVHGAPYRFQDPARFPLAHGGKDRHPYPVPIKVYDETIRVLKSAVQKAKLGRGKNWLPSGAWTIRRDGWSMRPRGPSFDAFVAGERAASAYYGGRSVFGWEQNRSDRQAGKPQIAFSAATPALKHTYALHRDWQKSRTNACLG